MARKSLITPVGFLSFPHLDVPAQPPINKKTGKPEGVAKYSMAIVFPEGTDIEALKNEVVAAAVERWGEGAVAQLKSGRLKNPIRDDATDVKEKKYPKGSIFFNTRSEMKPRAVFPWPDQATGQAMEIPEDQIKEVLYAGAKVRISVTAFAYDTAGNKGVSFGLGNVQLIDGTSPRWAGKADPQDEFAPVQTEVTPLGAPDMSDVETTQED